MGRPLGLRRKWGKALGCGGRAGYGVAGRGDGGDPRAMRSMICATLEGLGESRDGDVLFDLLELLPSLLVMCFDLFQELLL